MNDIRKYREEIDMLRSEFLKKLSELFEKPMHWSQDTWTKDDPTTPISDRNCIELMIDWE